MSIMNVYLKAYFRKNLGDDMFVDYILHRYPTVNFCAYTRKSYLPLLSKSKNLRLIPWCTQFFDRVYKKLTGKKRATNQYEQRADATVHIGGSIFIEPEAFHKPKDFYYPDSMFYIGCNFGPSQTTAYRNFIEERFKLATDVCLRDTASYQVFSHLDTVRVAPDLLFSYPKFPQKQQGRGIGIIVIDMESRTDLMEHAKTYEKTIASLIDLCKSKEIPITLFSFCEEEGDEKAIGRIMSYSQTKTADCCCYKGNILSVLKHLNACEYIIATRFHGMIIGWVLEKTVLPVTYSQKQLNVMQDLAYEGAYWDPRNPTTPEELLKNCLAAKPLQNVDQYIREADKQFAAFDRFVFNKS